MFSDFISFFSNVKLAFAIAFGWLNQMRVWQFSTKKYNLKTKETSVNLASLCENSYLLKKIIKIDVQLAIRSNSEYSNFFPVHWVNFSKTWLFLLFSAAAAAVMYFFALFGANRCNWSKLIWYAQHTDHIQVEFI